MKTEVSFDRDGWMNIKLEAETAEDASNLVRLAMNRNAEADKVSSFFAGDGKVKAFINLQTRRNNRGQFQNLTRIPKAQ